MSLKDEEIVENSSGDEADFEEEEEESIRIKGLFDDQQFASLNELFKHESQKNGFNILKVIKKFKLNMLTYIKMINYIRATVSVSLSAYVLYVCFCRNHRSTFSIIMTKIHGIMTHSTRRP